MYDESLKRDVVKTARQLGAEIVGVCSVDSWEAEPIQDPEFWPQNIWPWTKSVVVLAIPLFYPMAATAPSMVYKELYDTSNRITDNMGYNLSKYLMVEKGRRAMFFPRDCYDGLEPLLRHCAAAFSHVVAAYYAGVGSIGDSHNLVTERFGPRVRLVSVLTDAELEPDPKVERNLCIHCGKCLRQCPVQCFSAPDPSSGTTIYDYDKDRCTRYHMTLVEEHRFPCGLCATFCPVGEDLKLYAGASVVSDGGKRHCQTYGS